MASTNYDNPVNLHRRIEVLRRHMHRRAGQMGRGHPAVVWTSQRLDTLIVEWQRGGGEEWR